MGTPGLKIQVFTATSYVADNVRPLETRLQDLGITDSYRLQRRGVCDWKGMNTKRPGVYSRRIFRIVRH